MTCTVSLCYNDCEGAADADGPIRTTCYRCGQPACKSCSWIDRDPMVGRRTRRCRDCREYEEASA